ncbi:MAG TPA: hypothetical protein VK446_14160 [Methylocystis sp.]|nr:hypothetical protein [Methylocystis sp.]
MQQRVEEEGAERQGHHKADQGFRHGIARETLKALAGSGVKRRDGEEQQAETEIDQIEHDLLLIPFGNMMPPLSGFNAESLSRAQGMRKETRPGRFSLAPGPAKGKQRPQ